MQLMTDVHFQHLMENCQSQDELKVEDLSDRSGRWRPLLLDLDQGLSGVSAFSPSGTPDEGLMCVQKPDEAQHLPPRLEHHEALYQQVRTLNGVGVAVSSVL